jgi:hypothetical protein
MFCVPATGTLPRQRLLFGCLIRVYDEAGNLLETHERAGIQGLVRLTFLVAKCPRHIEAPESRRQPRAELARK